jgi:hypothetical protein
MMASMAKHSEDPALAGFGRAQEMWGEALAAHRLAPPDSGFSDRLAGLAAAASAEATALRAAHEAGYGWPPHKASSGQPPYELRPGTGRRGPAELWEAFDRVVAELNRTVAGSDLAVVAETFEAIAQVAGALAEAVAQEDSANVRRVA